MRLKTFTDLRGIWRSGQIAGEFLRSVEPLIRPGVATAEIDAFARSFLAERKARPSFLGYRGYPGAVCTSFNEEVVHGIPSARQLLAGDLLTVDIGVDLDGYTSDTARTFVVGALPTDPAVERLLTGTERSLLAGLAAAKPDQPLRLVSRAIQTELERWGLSVIRELTGHGVGFAVHEEPTLYNFDPGARRPFLQNGMVIAIEPMAALGSSDIRLKADNWTYVTADGSLSAHFEHTFACWNGTIYVLTDPADAAARATFG